jgi:hypothetical protein
LADACTATHGIRYILWRCRQENGDTAATLGQCNLECNWGIPGITTIFTITSYIHYAVLYTDVVNYTNPQTQTLVPGLSQVTTLAHPVACVPPSQVMKIYLGATPSVHTRIAVSRRHPSDGDGLRDTIWAFFKPAVAG